MASRVKRLKQNVCPEHGKMSFRRTQYGGLYVCQSPECTVRCWAGSTSTPACQATRDARVAAHDAFDGWWREKKLKRGEAYSRLAKFLGVPQSETHMGMFDAEQCRRVADFVAWQTRVEFQQDFD